MSNIDRLKEIESLSLKSGSHKSLDKGACIMEMVSYVAGEPWSDHPQCACPILTGYAIRLNDRYSDEHRQRLKPFISLLIGTRATDDVQIARKRLIMWRNVTVTYSLMLDLYKMPDLASELRCLKNTPEDMLKATSILKDSKKKIYAYADAYADAYAYADANAYADAHAHANTHANANANAYANANANAYADAHAYADANAYANADAFREMLVEVSLETLRLAIAIK